MQLPLTVTHTLHLEMIIYYLGPLAVPTSKKFIARKLHTVSTTSDCACEVALEDCVTAFV